MPTSTWSRRPSTPSGRTTTTCAPAARSVAACRRRRRRRESREWWGGAGGRPRYRDPLLSHGIGSAVTDVLARRLRLEPRLLLTSRRLPSAPARRAALGASHLHQLRPARVGWVGWT